MRVSWWDLYHNHVYGITTIVACVLSIAFYLWPLSANPIISRGAVAQYDQHGTLSLNLERRNSLQNKAFAEWVERAKSFKQRYFSDHLPTKEEYEQVILQFTDFAESSFTPMQVKSFQGIGSGAGGPMFRKSEELPAEVREQFVQIALIEFWLNHYIELNRLGEEPVDLKTLTL